MTAESSHVTSPCAQIRFVGAKPISLSDAEKKLVCGDPKNEGWSKIPLNQAQFFLKPFLQQRGYYTSKFRNENGVLVVDLGEQAKIKSLTQTGLPEEIDLSKKRKTKGKVMTPGELDAAQSWVRFQLQSEGYVCPAIETRADALSGEVHLDVQPRKIYRLETIADPEVTEVHPRIFKRFEAFEYGEPFDIRLMNLTSGRILREELFLSAYYDINCDEAGNPTIIQRVVPAKPRQITFGVGFDTERLLVGRAKFKHSRIGKKASIFESTLEASMKEQLWDTLMRIYILEPSSRFYLMPRVLLKRENENTYDSFRGIVSFMPGSTYDNQYFHLDSRMGPAYEYTYTIEGEGPKNTSFLAFETQTDLMSHLFEYYLGEPRSGWRLGFLTSSRLPGTLSNIHAHKLQLNSENLWNLGSFDPAIAIFGWRALIGSTWYQGEDGFEKKVPQQMRFYLGGDDSVRGFSRKEVPWDESGFLTAAYLGAELRAGEILPYKFQPLIFADAGMGGKNFFDLKDDIYWSPGVGIRWPSPIGVFRFTVAHGFIHRRELTKQASRETHWQYFFSFGQEF